MLEKIHPNIIPPKFITQQRRKTYWYLKKKAGMFKERSCSSLVIVLESYDNNNCVILHSVAVNKELEFMSCIDLKLRTIIYLPYHILMTFFS